MKHTIDIAAVLLTLCTGCMSLPTMPDDASLDDLIRDLHPLTLEIEDAAATEGCESEIWVIRHGEKDDHDHHCYPKNASTRPNCTLSTTGFSRSHHLRNLVRNGKWPRFDAVFAASPHKDPADKASVGSSSWKEYHTVHPLAAELGIPINISYGQTEISGVAAAMLAAARAHCGGTILVAWDHCQLVSVLQEAGCDLPLCRRCFPDVWVDTFYKLSVRFPAQTHPGPETAKQLSGASADSLAQLGLTSQGSTLEKHKPVSVFTSATLGHEHFKDDAWTVKTPGLYEGTLGYYHCRHDKNPPRQHSCRYGDSLEHVCTACTCAQPVCTASELRQCH